MTTLAEVEANNLKQRCIAKVDEKLGEGNNLASPKVYEHILMLRRALHAALEIRDRNDSDHFSPALNAQAAIRNNTLDLVHSAIAKELGVSNE